MVSFFSSYYAPCLVKTNIVTLSFLLLFATCCKSKILFGFWENQGKWNKTYCLFSSESKLLVYEPSEEDYLNGFNEARVEISLFFDAQKVITLNEEILVKVHKVKNGPFVSAFVLQSYLGGVKIISVDLQSMVDSIKNYVLFDKAEKIKGSRGDFDKLKCVMNYLIHVLWYGDGRLGKCACHPERYYYIWFPVLGIEGDAGSFQVFKVMTIFIDVGFKQLVIVFKPQSLTPFLLAPCATDYLTVNSVTYMEARYTMESTGYDIKVITNDGRKFYIRSLSHKSFIDSTDCLSLFGGFLEKKPKEHDYSIIKRSYFPFPKMKCTGKHIQEINMEQGIYRSTNLLESEL